MLKMSFSVKRHLYNIGSWKRIPEYVRATCFFSVRDFPDMLHRASRDFYCVLQDRIPLCTPYARLICYRSCTLSCFIIFDIRHIFVPCWHAARRCTLTLLRRSRFRTTQIHSWVTFRDLKSKWRTPVVMYLIGVS